MQRYNLFYKYKHIGNQSTNSMFRHDCSEFVWHGLATRVGEKFTQVKYGYIRNGKQYFFICRRIVYDRFQIILQSRYIL
jgi:hypothetical protein